MTIRQITDSEVLLLANLSTTLRADYAKEGLEWEGGPFAWIKTHSSRRVGAIGEKLVAGWCAAKGLDVTQAEGPGCDRTIGGLRAEIKFSTPWNGTTYVFQQFRDQDYEIAICLGIQPLNAHCWVVPKKVLMDGIEKRLPGISPQHGGRAGRDTAWLRVDPNQVPAWLMEWGGRSTQAFAVLERLSTKHS